MSQDEIANAVSRQAKTVAAGEYTLQGLGQFNVVLGKNGCGKSTLLKRINESLKTQAEWGRVQYITPERGGTLTYDANIEQNINNNVNWMGSTRLVNQYVQFRQQSVAQFRKLELTLFRESEARAEVANLQPYFDKLNSLLDNIEIRREGITFATYAKSTGQSVPAAQLSSGESELISLGIECLMFGHDLIDGKDNILLLDEPDVHLHPDLQVRLVAFLRSLLTDFNFRIVVATHSTPLLSGLDGFAGATVSFMKPGDNSLSFESIGDVQRRVLPVFGAHPLSNVFNQTPVLVVEGDDDERVWQQAVRSSAGALRVYPVSCDGVGGMNEYEQEVDRIVTAVYDEPRAYSLRDGDGVHEEIDDLAAVCRLRLQCRAAENLLLTDEVLSAAGLDWAEAQRRVAEWVTRNDQHSRWNLVKNFIDDGFNRREYDLKDIRNVLVGDVLQSAKPWEVLVGQAIAGLARDPIAASSNEGSLETFLGEKVIGALFTSEQPDVTGNAPFAVRG